MPELGGWAIAAITAVCVAAISSFANHRRQNRRDIEKVGFMPWTSITMAALLVAIVAAGLALKGL